MLPTSLLTFLVLLYLMSQFVTLPLQPYETSLAFPPRLRGHTPAKVKKRKGSEREREGKKAKGVMWYTTSSTKRESIVSFSFLPPPPPLGQTD